MRWKEILLSQLIKGVLFERKNNSNFKLFITKVFFPELEFFFFFFFFKKQENNSLKANLEKFKEIYKKLAIKIAIRIIILENEKEIKQLSNIHIL